MHSLINLTFAEQLVEDRVAAASHARAASPLRLPIARRRRAAPPSPVAPGRLRVSGAGR